jgi:hypothetical protein
MRQRVALLVTASIALLSSRASAAPSLIDLTEHIFGATNVNAVVGSGGLTAGISVDGDLTMLSWPGPTFANQMLYLSSNALDARSEPYFGALDGMGSYLGLLITTSSGTELVWLRDASFSHTQSYTQPDAPVVATTFRREDLGLTVVLTDIVSPTVDLLTRRLVLTRSPGSPVTGAQLVLYENISPTLSLIPQAPIADWLLGWANDFVAVYDATAKVIVHMHPSDRGIINTLAGLAEDPTTIDYGPIDALMRTTPTDAQVDNLLATLDTAFPPGVAAVVTTEPPPTSFQVGNDTTPFCTQAGVLASNIEALPKVFDDPSLGDYITAVAGPAECTDALPRVVKARSWTWAPTDALGSVTAGAVSGSRSSPRSPSRTTRRSGPRSSRSARPSRTLARRSPWAKRRPLRRARVRPSKRVTKPWRARSCPTRRSGRARWPSPSARSSTSTSRGTAPRAPSSPA